MNPLRPIVVGTPPFASFPSLPRTLRRWAGLVRERVEASSLAAAQPSAPGEPDPVTARESTQ